MPKWVVTAEVTISMHTVVDAESAEEAKERAGESVMMRLCHQCSGGASRGGDDEWRTSGEFDGDPKIIDATPAE